MPVAQGISWNTKHVLTQGLEDVTDATSSGSGKHLPRSEYAMPCRFEVRREVPALSEWQIRGCLYHMMSDRLSSIIILSGPYERKVFAPDLYDRQGAVLTSQSVINTGGLDLYSPDIGPARQKRRSNTNRRSPCVTLRCRRV